MKHEVSPCSAQAWCRSGALQPCCQLHNLTPAAVQDDGRIQQAQAEARELKAQLEAARRQARAASAQLEAAREQGRSWQAQATTPRQPNPEVLPQQRATCFGVSIVLKSCSSARGCQGAGPALAGPRRHILLAQPEGGRAGAPTGCCCEPQDVASPLSPEPRCRFDGLWHRLLH